MSSSEQSFQSAQYTPKNASFAYKLLLEVSPNYVSACVIDTGKKEVIGFKTTELSSSSSLDIQLNKAFTDPLISCEFLNVAIGFTSSCSTLLPNAYFNELEKTSVLELNSPIEENSIILHDNILSLNAKHIYAVKEALHYYFINKFPEAKFYCANSGVFDYLSITQKTNEAYSCTAHFSEKKFELFITKEGKVHFHNCFNYTQADDVLYFLLFTFEELKIKPENATVYVSGKPTNEPSILKLLPQYIGNVNPTVLKPLLKINSAIPKEMFTQYFSLFNLYLCE